MDPSNSSNPGKDEALSKAELNFSSKSLRKILIGFITALTLAILGFLTLFSGSDVAGAGLYLIIGLGILCLIISGVIAFALSLAGIMNCGRLIYDHPASREDIKKELYTNLSVILGIFIGAVLIIKIIKYIY
jgi:hypothetical protein